MKRFPIVIERGSLAHRGLQLLGWLGVAAFFLYVTGVAPNFSALRWAVGLTLAIAIQGLNIVTGFSGQISVGHSAFFGIGAYTTMILVADHGWPWLATLPVGGAVGFIVGFVLGIPALKIRGLYLALITLGLALAFPAIVKSDNFFGIDFASSTGGSNGLTITNGDVTATDRFPLAPAVVGSGRVVVERLGLRDHLRRHARDLLADQQPRTQPRRAGHDRHARQRDRRGRLGRLPRPVQGAGVRHERVRHGRRRGLLLARRDDDRSRHVRPRSGRSSSSPGSSSAASPPSSARRSAGSWSTGSRTCRSRASSSSATPPVGRSRSCRRWKGRRRRSSTASSSC